MKIYSQLRPTNDGINLLLDAQKELLNTATGRKIDEAELHMTVIHFGKVDTVFDMVSKITHQDPSQFELSIERLIQDWESCTTDRFELEHSGYGRLGKNKNTIVATFKATYDLELIHRKQLAALKAFFRSCGIGNVESFTATDPNFANALNLYPHVTLKKGHENHDLPSTNMGTITFIPMKVVY